MSQADPSQIVSEVLGRGTQTAEQERQRSLAVSAVLANAPELGIDAAVDRFGAALNPAEKELLKSLKPEEIRSLATAQAKLQQLRAERAEPNNNYNIYV